jgi:DNA-binding response OmpR family regulator
MSSASVTSEDSRPDLVLDLNARCLGGISMPPLLTGELKLLQYLGSRPSVWHSARQLSKRVFQREDPVATQLVWKYVSTLRTKASALPELIETCRRRGYRCPVTVRVLGDCDEDTPSLDSATTTGELRRGPFSSNAGGARQS